MLRFALTFLLTLLCLLGCQTSQSSSEPLIKEQESVTATLTSRRVADTNYIWWEAEQTQATNFPPPEENPFAPANSSEAAVLSGGKWIGIDGQREGAKFLEYTVNIPETGSYFFYTRKFWKHGPFRWRWDNQPWNNQGDNSYLMDGAALREFVEVNWVSLGAVDLSAGTHTLRLELTRSEGAAAFDCFVLSKQLLQPRGKLKPDERYASGDLKGWFLFDPEIDSFGKAALDLRSLNESVAGENGRIQVKGEEFIHEKTGRSVRFWAVNTGMESVQMDRSLMIYMARSLAKRGVNMVRLHGPLWSADFRKVDPADLERLFTFVAAMKQEGIYTSLSIYFPLWLKLNPDSEFAGYNDQNPFALLFFNPDFQKIYFNWWRSTLTTPNPATGKKLIDDPAIAFVELVNEDSYLFWTFEPYKNIPAPQMKILEQQFGTWLVGKYGSLDNAFNTWKNSPNFQSAPNEADQPQEGRVGFLLLYEIFSNPDSRRAQDTATFLMASQKQFFETAIAFLRKGLGYRGLIYASNWITADARILGPLDKYSNTVADFMDRHGYFEPPHKGDRAGYSVSVGDTYTDRSALLFTSTDQKQEQDFNLPVMDVRYNHLPSITTEINWTMPNRFRADFPLLTAAYGSLQGTNGFFFFAANHSWDSILKKFSIGSPAVVGQFPAAALLYRKQLLQPGKSVAEVSLKLDDLLALRGAPLTAPQNLDEFRKRDIPAGETLRSDRATSIDPLAFLVGKVNLNFSQDTAASNLMELSQFIDRKAKTVRSSTGELFWDYGNGLVTVNAPQAQGATGFLRHAGTIALKDLTLTTDLDYGTVVLVAMDDQPLGRSRRMLLQVMSEEQNFGWKTRGFPQKTIESVGTPPLIVQNLSGKVSLQRSDAARLKVTALDANGYPTATQKNASQITLRPATLYYLIEG
jgi:hypothetical protein